MFGFALTHLQCADESDCVPEMRLEKPESMRIEGPTEVPAKFLLKSYRLVVLETM